LLKEDTFKDIAINSLSYLTEKKMISVYGFVIMPNHIHLLWQLERMNGKEKLNASFHKFTSLTMQGLLKTNRLDRLNQHEVNEHDREHRFWKRDPMASIVENKEAEKILNYIHTNPIQEHWSLVKHPEDYKYSSAGYYEIERRDWSFVIDYRDRF
jgi:REP element-mobilizing transposase RayT